jgi:hypothetical protein
MPKSIAKEEKRSIHHKFADTTSDASANVIKEGIPETCVECNKSLDCMLSEYYKSENTVAEIKKWYHPKF